VKIERCPHSMLNIRFDIVCIMSADPVTEPVVDRWIDGERIYDLEPIKGNSGSSYTKKKYLNANHAKCEHLSTFKLSLLQHQQRTVQAMLDIELQRYIKVDITSYTAGRNYTMTSDFLDNPMIETCAGILSERFGSGKTIEVIALIVLHNHYYAEARKAGKIRMFPEISYLPTYHGNDVVKRNVANMHSFSWRGFTTEVRRVYRTMLSQTLVFAGRVPIRQWQEDIANFSYLRSLLVENVRDIRKLHKAVFEPDKEYNMN
jgi:hypothetical protein